MRECRIDTCEKPVRCLGLCAMHESRQRIHGDPLFERRPGRPRQEEVGYAAVHLRLKVDRGKASSYACVDCDGPAKEWSQIHGTEDFEPRCKSCHNRYDGIGKWNKGRRRVAA